MARFRVVSIGIILTGTAVAERCPGNNIVCNKS